MFGICYLPTKTPKQKKNSFPLTFKFQIAIDKHSTHNKEYLGGCMVKISKLFTNLHGLK